MTLSISEASFVKSLRPLHDDAWLKWLSAEDVAGLLDRYWTAISELCPEAVKEPKKSLLFKTAGVSVLHAIFPNVVAYLVSQRKDVRAITKDEFKEVLAELSDLNDTYWSSKNEEGAKRFLGEAGYGHLASKWRHELPKPTD